MNKYPLRLQSVLKTAIWGGTRLIDEWGKTFDGALAESWELTVREKEMSKIINGEAAGMSLSEYFELVGYDCVYDGFKKGERFPLLVKLIDAAKDLSVQVHPDDDYARDVENDCGKTEMWYIVDADEGARLVYGFAKGIDEEAFSKSIDECRIADSLRSVPVSKGDVFYIPSGLVHAIGGGILIAEIQQNSDLTYRVYDYDRVDANGNKRELHVDKAKAVARPFSDDELEKERYSNGRDGAMVNCKYFRTELITLDTEQSIAAENSFVSLLCIGGEGQIICDGASYEIKKGDSYFLPLGIGECTVKGKLEFIVSSVNC